MKHRGSGDGGSIIGSGGRWRRHWQWRRQTAAVATAGAGKNGGGRWKQRQQWGQTTINQKAAAISAETAIVVAAETAATETAAAETAAGGGGGAYSGRGGDRCGSSGGRMR